MTGFEATILGIIQGATEFLPISSSGHLVIAQKLFGLQEPQLVFDIILHFATLLSVLYFFWKDILALRLRDYFLMAVATIPAVIVGLLFKDQIEAIFASGATLGWEFLITAACNFSIHFQLKKERVTTEKIETRSAFLVGVAQAIAIAPAISRSGLTVLAGLYNKLDRETAFRFSFLISVPAILGANMVGLLSVVKQGAALPSTAEMLLGTVSAAVVGVLSLFVFRYMIKHAQFIWFGGYCFVLALIVFLWQSGIIPGWS